MTEQHADRDYRRAKLREFGARPYPMAFRRTDELRAFARWCIKAYDKGPKAIPWSEFWGRAKGEPRRLGDRVTLPLFREAAEPEVEDPEAQTPEFAPVPGDTK